MFFQEKKEDIVNTSDCHAISFDFIAFKKVQIAFKLLSVLQHIYNSGGKFGRRYFFSLQRALSDKYMSIISASPFLGCLM